MIENKIDAAEKAVLTQDPIVISLYATKNSPGYVDGPRNWTLQELRWLIAQADHHVPLGES